MNTTIARLYQYIGQQINGSPRQKSVFICWLSQPVHILIGLGSVAGLLLSQWMTEIYNPLLWAGVLWGGAASIFWTALALYGNKREMTEAQEHRFSQQVIALFSLSGIISLLLVGPFNLVTGIVLTGCVLIGLLLFPARQITTIFAVSITVILAYSVVISLGGATYQPLLARVYSPVAQFWYDFMALLAATLIVIKDSFTVAALTDSWRHREAQTLHQASTDPLTGVANRRHATEALEQAFRHSEITGRPLSVVVLDLDHFKEINDRYGHQMGDLALQLVARCLQDTLRDNDLVGRYGGEEFLLILPGSDAQNASLVAERCAKALRDITLPRINNLPEIRLTASFGVCSEVARGCASARTMVEKADAAMYQAKHAGRDRVTLATCMEATA
ncbi:GGDEF domain-containing protein [Alcanivorax sp. DP30]|uniref:GGDEF domain-containing protein n=1 Tax=Alcanivorax sp. DP30 TaxID=2606217 RepID=UPI00136CAB2D|nr:GGDEF domain-containing protein [Alcanivorax sp. DP30]MZR63958.1 diguanylate cyclase [Alcanivorax sp. DP30]